MMVWLVVTMVAGGWEFEAAAAPSERSQHFRPRLAIEHDAATGWIQVTWQGKGRSLVCHEPGRPSGMVRGRRGAYLFQPEADQMTFELAGTGGGVISENAVGYYTLTLPPGLSLVAYQFYHTNYTLGFQWPDAPDGAQFFKYTDGLGYEVSTYDALRGSWSNPTLTITPGDAYYFRNPTDETIAHLFVGEVPQGELHVSIPAGLSAKASVVPQSGGLTWLLGVPGEDGDEVRLYVNDGLGNGNFLTSVFNGSTQSWEPDLAPRVGEGFWMQRQNPATWVRIFYVNF